MATEGTRRQLEIVRTPRREHIVPGSFFEANQQTNLFPSPRRGLVIFVYFPDVTEREFRDTLVQAKPRYIFEFRPAPRFDIGSLNRQLAFRLFSDQQANYIDLTSALMEQGKGNSVLFEFKSFAKNYHVSLDRPTMILLNKSEYDGEIGNQIAEYLSSLTTETLELFEIPRYLPGL